VTCCKSRCANRLGENNNNKRFRIVFFVSPNPVGLQVLKIVSENIQRLDFVIVCKSSIYWDLRQIVTCGILEYELVSITEYNSNLLLVPIICVT
jgi:hypothetical protein